MRRLPGQTLIELLITVSVVTTGLFAAATLVFSNLQLSDRDADEVVSVNLAREGIELAKELRDANWLAGNPFDAGFSSGTDYSATPNWDGGAGTEGVTFNFTANIIKESLAQVRQSTNLATPGFYTQADPSATPTIWRRLLTFHPICDTPSGYAYLDDGADCGANPKVGIRVESHVAWVRKNQQFDRVMYEDLYDWR